MEELTEHFSFESFKTEQITSNWVQKSKETSSRFVEFFSHFWSAISTTIDWFIKTNDHAVDQTHHELSDRTWISIFLTSGLWKI